MVRSMPLVIVSVNVIMHGVSVAIDGVAVHAGCSGQDFTTEDERRATGGPQEFEPLELPWPSVVLRSSSVVSKRWRPNLAIRGGKVECCRIAWRTRPAVWSKSRC